MKAPIRVYGATIDDQTRCIHWQSALDIVALKFKCCDKFYPCYQCHNEAEDHAPLRWPPTEFDRKAILCGVCKSELAIDAYMKTTSCPSCGAAFNPGCRTHYHLYFEV